MKNQKISLKDIKVTSFVTGQDVVRGGTNFTEGYPICSPAGSGATACGGDSQNMGCFCV